MKLLFERIDTLPRLAWCARVELGVAAIRVLHGPDVEVGDGFFCEGAWAGEFTSADFESAPLMGSGGKIERQALLIATSDHTMERVWVLRQAKSLLVSNSCAFVLAQAQNEPDPDYLLYGPRLASITHGLNRYARSIPTRNGNPIRMFCHCNLQVGIDHRLIERPKREVRDFTDFADYRSFLAEQVSAIASNANAPQRRVRYRPIATISSGYDSAACAVFAQQVGCAEAITFRSSRPHGAPGLDDSGAAIAGRLGMSVRAYDRFDYLDRTGFPEAEGGMSEFLCLSECLERRILFTGFNGGAIWGRWNGAVGPFLRRRDTSGDGLAEFRLRVGFVHLPVAYLGATQHASVYRISGSKEMEPWWTGRHYDKPIARRLIEEAGVDRGMFGVAKKTVAVVAGEEGFERTMTPTSFADFSRFVAAHQTVRVAAKLRLYRAAQLLARLNRAFNRIVLRLSERAGKPIWLSPLVPSAVEQAGRLGTYLFFFHWSIEKLMERYRVPESSAVAYPPELPEWSAEEGSASSPPTTPGRPMVP
jgi:hypothetical protein